VSSDHDVTRIVRSWMAEGVTTVPDRVLNAVISQLPTTRQRRPWGPARMFKYMSFATRIALAAVIMVGLTLAGLQLMQLGINVGRPAPRVTPTPAHGAQMLEDRSFGTLAPGIYQVGAVFPVRITFTVPAGFALTGGGGSREEVGIQAPRQGLRNPTYGVRFQIVDSVQPDPCHAGHVPAPSLGPTADDLVTALEHMVGFTSGPVADVNLGGRPAKAFDQTNAISTDCDGQTIDTVVDPSGSRTFVSPGERQRFYIVEVNGTRMLITTYYHPNGDATDATIAASLAAIVQSISFR
jgi:hypothetical protein